MGTSDDEVASSGKKWAIISVVVAALLIDAVGQLVSGFCCVGASVLFLIGEYFHAVDEKFRLTIPVKLREAINAEVEGPGFYAVQGFDGVLSLYTPKRFRRMTPPLDAKLMAVPEVRDFSRLRYGLTEKVEVDRLGRVLMSEPALRRAGITKDVAIVGVRDHIEIWDRTKWETFVAEKLGKHDELAQAALRAEQQRGATPPATNQP
jgi:MraZ protein